MPPLSKREVIKGTTKKYNYHYENVQAPSVWHLYTKCQKSIQKPLVPRRLLQKEAINFYYSTEYLKCAGKTCWYASWDGDPGRTLIRESAKKFKTEQAAQKAVKNIIANNPHRRFAIDDVIVTKY